MLERFFQFISPYSAVLADFATIAGGISIVAGVLTWSKNRIRKKSFQFEINSIRSNYDSSLLQTSIRNFTDKTVCIIELKLIIGNTVCVAKERYSDGHDYSYRYFRNIIVPPFSSYDFDLIFDIKKSDLPRCAKLKAITTQKNISYKIPLLNRNKDQY